MQVVKQRVFNEFGHELLDSITIPESTLNILFAALLLTAFGVFLGGNLLLLDASVLHRSARIALPCFTMILIFYMASRTVNSVTWGLVLTYSMMCLVTLSRKSWLIPIVYSVAMVGAVYTFRFLRVDRQQWGLVLLMAVIATATVLGCTRAYTSFDMLARLHVGNVHQDTLFHASIAAMIKNYGVVSTGLHGLVETPYHILSHVLIASISQLSGLGVIEVYGVATWVLFAPILIFSVVACCVMVDTTGKLNPALAWTIACFLLVVSPLLFHYWVLSDSFFVSESYLVSLGIFLLGLSLLFKRQCGISDLFLIVLLSAFILKAKISVGFIFAGLWFLKLLLVQREKTLLEWLALLMSAIAVTWLVLDSVPKIVSMIAPIPMDFISQHSLLGAHLAEAGKAWLDGEVVSWHATFMAIAVISSFFVFHFVLSWIVITRAFYMNGFLATFRVPIALYSLATVLVGTLVVSFLAIAGGSAYYFSNVAFFVALPGVVVFCTHWVDTRHGATSMAIVLGVLLVCLLNVKTFYKASALNSARPVFTHNTLIDSLMELRRVTPINVAMQSDNISLANNPVERCSAQPFVFPAVSERPWVDIVPDGNECTYVGYGYRRYGITNSKRVTVPPVLLPGMELREWSFPTAKIRSPLLK